MSADDGTGPLTGPDPLTLPEALMAFLHNGEGQLYQSAHPRQVTAAAELGELLLTGLLVPAGEGAVAAAAEPESTRRPWMAEAVADLGDGPTRIDAWIRGRRSAVETQRQAALDRGVLHHDRGKLAGLVGYDKYLVDDAVRDHLLAELDAAQPGQDPRTAGLARLITTPGIARMQRFDRDRRAHLTALADSAATPDAGPMFTALDYGIATVIGLGVLGS